jgi:hypothetical protein
MSQQVYWRLNYDRSVIAKLYSLRERGFPLHDQIKALKYTKEPWFDVHAVADRPGRYEFEFQGFWVGFEISENPEDREPTLIILYIEESA